MLIAPKKARAGPSPKSVMMQTFKELNAEDQHWLLVAVAHILMADRLYEPSEKEFFEGIMKHIFHREAKESMAAITEILAGTPLIQLPEADIEKPEHRVFVLDVLASAVYANGKMKHAESVKFFEAGLCLGIDMGTLTYRLNLEGEKFLIQQKLASVRKKLLTELN